VPDKAEVARIIQQLRARLWLAADHQVRRSREQLAERRRSLLRLAPAARIEGERQQVDEGVTALNRAMEQRIRSLRQRLESRRLQLAALNPHSILARGYAILRKDGRPIVSVQQVAPGQQLHVRVSDGEFSATVAA
jgi:exodeoxyribonuclease VII large subunit